MVPFRDRPGGPSCWPRLAVKPTHAASSMRLLGRAGARAHGADGSPIRSRPAAGARSGVRSRTDAGAWSRVRIRYGSVAARKNSLGSCRWRILSVDASLICRRCRSYRLVKTFGVSYLTARVAGRCARRSYLTARVARRCARRSCLTTRGAGVPRARSTTTCTASGSTTTCTATSTATAATTLC